MSMESRKHDRDTPMSPKVEHYFYGEYYKCPSCELIIAKYDREKMNFCCRCGQAIDWRETYKHEKE